MRPHVPLGRVLAGRVQRPIDGVWAPRPLSNKRLQAPRGVPVTGDVVDSGTNVIVLPETAGAEAIADASAGADVIVVLTTASEVIADQGSENVVIVSTGNDVVADAGSGVVVILTTGDEALGDVTTDVVVLVASGTHAVEGVAQEPPPPPAEIPPPPEPEFPWSLMGSGEYAAQMRMEDQHLVDRIEREGW